MKTKKRTPPEKLVGQSRPKTGYASWYERLPPCDQVYVCQVVEAMRQSPGVSPYTVAGALITELSINRNRQAVCRKLKELLHDKT